MWMWILTVSLFAGLLYIVKKIENQPKEVRVPVRVKNDRNR